MRAPLLLLPAYLLLPVSWMCLALAPGLAQEAILFADSTQSSHLGFRHEDGADDEGYLVSLMGSGLALFDYDNDGRTDVYFLNGRALPFRAEATPSANGLFRNLGENQFSDYSRPSRSNVSLYSLGVAVGDIDNDGFADVALSNFGSITLLRNAGDGTFSDQTNFAGLAQAGVAFGAGVAFLDIENDGDLDLYVADYVNFTFERYQELAPASFPYPPGPEQFDHRADHLFKNNGDGTFVDWSEPSGIAQWKSPSMGVVCGDFDGDADTDIFVCCDARPNLLFQNDGQGVFTQAAELAGVAFSSTGIPVGSMGAEPGDVDNDGAEDLFITDYSAQLPILFKNLGELGFEDASRRSRAGRDVIPHAKWGAGLFDFDNDGDRDLMIGNGHLLKNAHQVEQLTSYKVRNCLMANNGKGVFDNITDRAGAGMKIVESSRGLGFDDLDNDGDVDCVVLNSDASANYLENRSAGSHNWIQIQLVGTSFNRDGVGAKVTVESGDLVQTAEVHSGRSYQSHYASRLYFGLGKRTTVDRVRVDWLGKSSSHSDLLINQNHTLREP